MVWHDTAARWLLVDCGEVLSAALPSETLDMMASLAGQPATEFAVRYWQSRAYELGQPPGEYWSGLLARDLSSEPDVVDQLTHLDAEGWSRLNPMTLPLLVDYAGPGRVSHCSNAPHAVTDALEHEDWVRHLYSCAGRARC